MKLKVNARPYDFRKTFKFLSMLSIIILLHIFKWCNHWGWRQFCFRHHAHENSATARSRVQRLDFTTDLSSRSRLKYIYFQTRLYSRSRPSLNLQSLDQSSLLLQYNTIDQTRSNLVQIPKGCMAGGGLNQYCLVADPGGHPFLLMTRLFLKSSLVYKKWLNFTPSPLFCNSRIRQCRRNFTLALHDVDITPPINIIHININQNLVF